ncbi:MAG: hypothetical protein WC796_00465 [Candidatus Pacearchaeota archaeon]
MTINQFSKRGQVTIFIIIAVVIIAAVILFFTMTQSGKKIINNLIGGEIDVNGELQNCLSTNQKVNDKINLILSQGGSSDPQNYFSYNNTKVEYLCYTSEYLKTCYVQRPRLVTYVETEITKAIKQDIQECINSLEQDLRDKNYEVNSNKLSKLYANLTPSKIIISTDYGLSVKKPGDTTGVRTFENVKLTKPSKAYDLIMLATSIINYESAYGNSEILNYMIYYPNVRVEKERFDPGIKVYVLTNRDTRDQFVFAVKSLAFPPGYEIPKTV